MQILDCCQSPSHCLPLSGDRELTTVGNAKGWRSEKMNLELTFRKPSKLIGVWLNTERALLFGEG